MNKRLVIVVFYALFFTACSENTTEQPVTSFEGTAMTIDYRITLKAPLDKESQKLVKRIIAETFHEIDSIYNMWNPFSELSQLNQAGATTKLPLSPKLEKLLLLTDVLVKTTDGKFDPTIAPLQKIWKSALTQNKMPLEIDLDAVTPSVGWDKLHISDGLFWKDHPLTSLDLGGIAKGYGVDLLAERLHDAGFADVYVEWGGEIRTFGNHPEGRPWRVFISRLGDTTPERAIAFVELKNQALATSGDYLQNWSILNSDSDRFVHYSHILSPETKSPLEITRSSIASASVLANTCSEADGLATAAMMFRTVDEAYEWAKTLKEKQPELQFWFLSREQSPNDFNNQNLGVKEENK